MHPPPPVRHWPPLLALAALVLGLAACATWEPLGGVPVTADDREHYELTDTRVAYRDGTLLVHGDFALKRGTEPPPAAHFHVRVLNAAGQVVADVPAKFARDAHEHNPSDPRLGASFSAQIPVARDQVARIELAYHTHPAPHPG